MNLHVILLNIFKHIEETFDMQTSSKPVLDQQYGIHTNVRWIIEFPAAVYKISEIFGQNQCSRRKFLYLLNRNYAFRCSESILEAKSQLNLPENDFLIIISN